MRPVSCALHLRCRCSHLQTSIPNPNSQPKDAHVHFPDHFRNSPDHPQLFLLLYSFLQIPPRWTPQHSTRQSCFGKPWPQVPWTYVLDETASIAIENYGRTVCSGDLGCEERIMDGMNQIVEVMQQEYVAEHERIDSFAGDGVNFWIRQETTLPKVRAVQLVSTLRRMMLRYGTWEVTHGGILNYGMVAVTFELTFSGNRRPIERFWGRVVVLSDRHLYWYTMAVRSQEKSRRQWLRTYRS